MSHHPLLVILLVSLAALSHCAYNQALTKVASSYCAISHCPKKSIEDWSCKLCSVTEKLIDVHYVQNQQFSNVGIIGYNSARNIIVVSWRGSIDAENWAEDFSFEKVAYNKCKGCTIHIGFHFAFLAISKQLYESVDRLITKYPSAGIEVSGHSLGGAIATIAGLELQLKYNKVKTLIVLGCPRIGNVDLAHFINLKIGQRFRIIHNRDLFAHLPFQGMGFHHIANQVLYNQDFTQYKVCDDSGQDKTCSQRFFPNYVPADHDLYFYQMDTSVC